MSLLNVIIMGFGKMPADCARILLNHNIAINIILETEQSVFSSLQGVAERMDVPFERPARDETTTFLRSLTEPTVILSINNNYIFPSEICHKDNLSIINFHGSLLPRYPGHGKVIPAWVIFNGESRHGVTWHLVNADIDSGNILCQADFPVSETDRALNIMMRVISLGTDLFSRHWDKFIAAQCEGNTQTHTQDHIYSGRDLPNDGHIDISWNFLTMSRFLRSMDYGTFKLVPPPKINLDGTPYVVTGYRITAKDTNINDNAASIRGHLEQKANQATFLFREGIITLSVLRKDSYGEITNNIAGDPSRARLRKITEFRHRWTP
jgi:methionyl-tRNA formyltransferase